jgi:hypothetical protein
MSDADVRTPVHHWLVGALSVPWNGYGAFDYAMSKLRGDAYLISVGMSPDQIRHFHALPGWMTAVWAIGVWGALLGSVLLLFRSRLAAPVFAVSLAAYLLSVVHAHLIAPTPGSGAAMLLLQGVILAGCVFLAWYSRRARRLGVLR